MPNDLFIDRKESTPTAGRPNQRRKETATLMELASDFHLFTLGPVYVGANIDTDLLQVFAEQEGLKFDVVLNEQSVPMFKNLNEWDYLIQGIERSPDELDLNKKIKMSTKPRVSELFTQFLQGWEFVNRETQFYARIYSRPVQIVMPGAVRGVPVEVYMLASNKGTQALKGANPYTVIRDERIADHIKKEAEAVFDVLEGS